MNQPNRSIPENKLVFISHSSVNVAQAMALVKVLEANGIGCWIAPRDLLSGQPYPAEIVRGIDLVQGMVLILTKESNSSDMVLKEVERGVSKKKTIFPMRFEKIELNQSLEFLISTPHWIDVHQNGFENASHQLAQAISKTFDGVPSPAPLKPKKVNPKLPMAIGAGGLALLIAIISLKFGGDKAPPTASVPPAVSQSSSQATSSSAALPLPVAAIPIAAAPALAIAVSQADSSAPPVVQVLSKLGTSVSAERVRLIDKELPTIKGILAVTDAEKILGAAAGADRVAALKLLAPKLADNINAKQLRDLLTNTSFQDRVRAIELLLPKTAVPISNDEAQAWLNDTNNFRLAAISLMSAALSKELSGKQASDLLGPLAFEDRLKAIDKLMPSLKKEQTPDDLIALLANTNNFKAQGIRQIKSLLPSNLSPNAAIELLDGLAFEDRTKSIELIVGALVKPIDTGSAVALLKGTQNFRLEGLKILAPHLVNGIGANEAAEVLDMLGYDSRVAGIKLISAKIKRPFTTDELASLTKNTGNFLSEATRALK